MAAGSSADTLKNDLLRYIPAQNIDEFRTLLDQEGSDTDKKFTLDHLIREVLQYMVVST